MQQKRYANLKGPREPHWALFVPCRNSSSADHLFLLCFQSRIGLSYPSFHTWANNLLCLNAFLDTTRQMWAPKDYCLHLPFRMVCFTSTVCGMSAELLQSRWRVGSPADSFLCCSWHLAEKPERKAIDSYIILLIAFSSNPQSIKLVMPRFIPWNLGLAITSNSVNRSNSSKFYTKLPLNPSKIKQ